MLKVALIGAGMVSRHHLIGWRGLADRAEVVAIVDPDLDRAKARAAEFGIARAFSSASVMASAVDIDAVDIVAPRHVHAELVRLFAPRGTAVMCQKPLAPSFSGAEALVAEVGNKVRLMVHENWRFRPYYRQVREWIESGAIGTPRTCALSLFTSGLLAEPGEVPPALARQPFMRDEPRMLVNEVLIHHLDVLRYLLGELEVVSASLARHTAIAGEDSASIALRSQSGALVTLLGSMAVQGYPAASVDRLEIGGSDGRILLEDHRLELRGQGITSLSFDPGLSYQQSYDRTIGHFVASLASGAPFETAPDDNLRTLWLVEDVYRMAGIA